MSQTGYFPQISYYVMLRLNQSEGWFTELMLRSWNWYFCLSHSSVLIRYCISMSELPIAKYTAVLGSIEVWSSGLRAYSCCKARQMACSHAHFCRQAQWISYPLKVSLILAQLSNLIGSGLFLGVYCHSNGIALHFRQILGSVFLRIGHRALVFLSSNACCTESMNIAEWIFKPSCIRFAANHWNMADHDTWLACSPTVCLKVWLYVWYPHAAGIWIYHART